MTLRRPISLTLAALGGQGGGVVSGWLTDVARRERYVVQTTSVPGVAQRTGATIYYFEFFPESELPFDGRRPVMALMPSPNDVDIVVASELVEAGRVILRGLVTPDRTTLILSTHRAFTISEKSHTADGRVDSARILDQARLQSQRLVAFDMAEIAERSGAVISAVIFGAIAGGANLPFSEHSYREAIRSGGIAIERNLAGFELSLKHAKSSNADQVRQQSMGPGNGPVVPLSAAILSSEMRERIRRELPEVAQDLAAYGAARLIDYQDCAYAQQYLDQLVRIAALEQVGGGFGRLSVAVAKGLALWMSFDDTIRIADLKTREARVKRVQAGAKAKPGQIVQIREFMKPRVEEICGTLPASIGRRLRGSPLCRAVLNRVTGGRQVRTSTILGFALLRSVAAMRIWRRRTLRYADEHARIRSWLEQIASLAERHYDLAVELADCQRLVRGYGSTYERGITNFESISRAAQRLLGRSDAARELTRLRDAALADETGDALRVAITALGA